MKRAGAVRTKGYPGFFLNYMNDELLKYAVENGMIDLLYVQEQIEMNKRKELLEKHPYKIYQGKDGKWHTYVSILLDNGVDKRFVQDVAGHIQILMSERNYHRNRKSDQKKKILSEIPEFKNARFMF